MFVLYIMKLEKNLPYFSTPVLLLFGLFKSEVTGVICPSGGKLTLLALVFWCYITISCLAHCISFSQAKTKKKKKGKRDPHGFIWACK